MKNSEFNGLVYLYENFTKNDQSTLWETRPTGMQLLDIDRCERKLSSKKKQLPLASSRGTRVYTSYEFEMLGRELLSFLLQLEKFAIVTERMREEIMNQLLLEFNRMVTFNELCEVIIKKLRQHKHLRALQVFLHGKRVLVLH